MKTRNWEKIKDAFAQVLETPENERADFLSRACGEDPDLRAEVESLLAAHDEDTEYLIEKRDYAVASFFDDVALPAGGAPSYAGRQFGSYKIIREIGRGGMGAVFLAERADGEFSQQVALKIIRQSFADAELEKRFRRERQILAALNHPNVARLLDGGVSQMGEPFLAMEYVEGVPVVDYADRLNLDLEERLRLFLKICAAVSYAHRNLIIHRDLKPSNILVDEAGEPKLLDFGLAKILDEGLLDASQTETAFRAFTPAYASPEQMRGQRVTTASDVYSLGVVLYELLTGGRPFRFEHQSYEEILRSIDTLEPLLPSLAATERRGGSLIFSDAAAGEDTGRNKDARTNPGPEGEETAPGAGAPAHQPQPPPPASLSPTRLKGDLDNIILTALRREPERRYQSVESFAKDVERHLQGLPVSARANTFSYRAAKFLRRNRIAVGAAAFVLLSLVGGLAVALWQADIARRQKSVAEKRFNDVRRLSNSLLFEISPRIERLQGATEAREITLARALEYLDALGQEAAGGGDPGLQNELAAAYEKVGDLQGHPTNPNFIDTEAAVRSYEKARAIRLDLLGKNPGDRQQQLKLAENYRVAGTIYGQANELKTEAENLRAALGIYESLLAGEPDSAGLKFGFAQVNYDIAKNFSSGSNDIDAFAYYERVIGLLSREIENQVPNQPDYSKLLAECQSQYALALSWEGRQPEAEAQIAKAIEVIEGAVARHPNDANLRSGLWRTYWLASSIYEEVNDALSHEYATKGLKLIQETVDRDPANLRARQQLSKSLSQVGQTSMNTGRPAEGLAYVEKAQEVLLGITESRSKNNSLKLELAANWMRLAEAKFKQGLFAESLPDLDEAVKVQQGILENFPDDVRTARNLAMTYESIADAHAALAEKEGGEKSRPRRRAALENYQKALAILNELDAKKSLAGFDRKFLERLRAAVEKLQSR